MAAYSELLLLTADFSLDEREYTPRAGIWIDEPSSQLRYEESGVSSIRVQASQISQKNPLEEVSVFERRDSDAPSPAASLDWSDAADDGQAVDSLASVLQQHKDATLSAVSNGEHAVDNKADHDACPVLQSNTGLYIINRQAAIRNVPHIETSWFAVEGGEPLKTPPVLDSALHLKIGDLFLQFQVTSSQREVRIWMVLESESEEGCLIWHRCRDLPITHPILSNRTLGFVTNNPTTPTWVLASTRKKTNQPTVIDD